VRGTGVRSWGRYIEARFIYEAVVGRNGQRPVMNMTEMASHMGRHLSWVQRLRDAYRFAMEFVDQSDDHPDLEPEQRAERIAWEHFSTLEEISKAKVIGSQLRDYNNPTFDELREDVFEMVRNNAFREYRDARFLKEFHDDPEKWAQLKSGEPHVASRLALEVRTNNGSAKSKVAALEGQVQRAIDREEVVFGDEDIEALERAISRMYIQVHEGVRPFRIHLKRMVRALSEASMADVKDLTEQELSDFRKTREYFDDLVAKHWEKN
jgi:hypothetical protein